MATTAVIEIHDTGIVVADGRRVRAASPGVAVRRGRELTFGDAARARARLDPRATFDRFWERLDQQPLTRDAGDAQSHADLAYFHLRGVWAEANITADQTLLAAPADYDNDQLALLLGVVQACDIATAGLVAAPVAAAASTAQAPLLLLDAQSHRISATRIDNGDGPRLGEVGVVTRHGLAELEDAWAASIARRFVIDTRFDPLHAAASEQALYDRLPRWLAALAEQPVARLELDTGRRAYQVDMDRAALAEAAERVYAPVAAAAAASDARVAVSHRLARLPGLVERVSAGCQQPPLVLAADAVARGALAHAAAIRSEADAPAYVTRLPAAEPARAGPPPAPTSAAAPTHVLHGWRAYRLGGRALALPPGEARGARVQVSVEGVFLHAETDGVCVNGRPLTGPTRLAVGDLIEVGGESMRVIAADSGDGAA